MNSIAAGSSEEREELFRDTAEVHPLVRSAGLVEKDFWLCWVLSRLVSTPPQVSLIFKGGTSLSKAYSAIFRFSEDIDLSLNRSDLGFDRNQDPSTAPSRKSRDKRLQDLTRECESFVTGELLEHLHKDFYQVLGKADGLFDWNLAVDSEDPQTLLFDYPVTGVTPAAGEYVSPVIRLEFGARSDQWPVEDCEVVSFAAESFSDTFAAPSFVVSTLAVERTFWEKATILHALAHGGIPKLRPRMARHYYDTFCLAISEYGDRALVRIDLLEIVAEHKSTFFPAAWARYDQAVRGTLALLPPAEMISPLHRDYRTMEGLFFHEPPEFDEILDTLRDLENSIHTSGE